MKLKTFFFRSVQNFLQKNFFFVIFLKMSKFSKNPKISTKSKKFEKIMFLDSKSTLELFVRLPMIQACSTCAYNKLRASEDHPTTFHPLNRAFSDPDGPITIALTMELPCNRVKIRKSSILSSKFTLELSVRSPLRRDGVPMHAVSRWIRVDILL